MPPVSNSLPLLIVLNPAFIISEAVIAARRGVNANFDWVHVGIAGQHIKSLQHRGILMRDSNIVEISQEDIDRLIGDMFKLVLPPGDKIIHVIPQEYAVDNEQGILDPIETYWSEGGRPESYRSGSWGPEAADAMMARDGRVWRRP